ncbi:zinc-binding dehydrogenase [Polyplosphaeria fusca]|uniref:Zinc-binding dehydrogenase n=1 Tax=Polyplosphaeria fusca TaxID=682080 RepID=A0A9P4V6V4_9PLEO|nr:zinc-binding dehydrogenase [Polyplosphaeria fusca]
MSSPQGTPIRKTLISAYGDWSNVSIVSDTLPPPPAHHVQILVLYSAMGGSDINMRNGNYPLQRAAPLTPGYVVVGRVALNGPSSTKFSPGTIVACLSKYDGQQTLTNMPEKYLVPVPADLHPKQAAAMVLDYTTAYGMVTRGATVRQGTRVFIHGLSGAVGHAVLQLCLLRGATCYGTASESNHEQLRAEGAVPFTYRDKEWMARMNEVGGAEVVFDSLGFESFDESWAILTKGHGHLVGYGGNLYMLAGDHKPRSQIPMVTKLYAKNVIGIGCGRKTSFFGINRDQKTFEPELKELFAMGARGEIVAPIKKTVELDEVPDVHRDYAKLSGIGSLVVRIGGED